MMSRLGKMTMQAGSYWNSVALNSNDSIRSDTAHALHDYIHTGGRISSLYLLVQEQHSVARTCLGITNFTPNWLFCFSSTIFYH